jgi:hypothetical protein
MGLRAKQQHQEIIRHTDGAAGDLLGLPAGAFDRLDGATLAALLKRDDTLVRAVADLLDEEALAHDALGDAATAARRWRLAADLRATLT